MNAIGIIDDRSDYRQSLKRLIKGTLRNKEIETWEVIDTSPLERTSAYSSWIYENEIAVLVIDERLYESSQGRVAINYHGHNLVDYLRHERAFTLPIFLISSQGTDNEDVQGRFKDVEGIVDKRDLQSKINAYIEKFIRVGQKYSETYEKELNELSISAEKYVLGKASKKDKEKLNAIRTKLELSFPLESFEEKSTEMKELEQRIKALSKLKSKIEKKLGNKS